MQRNMQKAIAAMIAAAISAGVPVGSALAQGNVDRINGSTRYDTMSDIVSTGFESSRSVVVATGQGYADALAASALAGAKGCPLILTDSSSLSYQARNQISRLGARYVYVVGGTSAVSDETYKALENMSLGVVRIDGPDRIATSLAIMKEVKKESSSSQVIIASGSNFADALAISPYAYAKKTPIVLANSNGELTDAAVKAIKDAGFTKALVLGGDKAVKFAKVQEQLGFKPEKLAGADRYDTAAKIVDWERKQGMTYNECAVATGENFPDALAGSALCGVNNSVLVLTKTWNSAPMKTLLDNAYQLEQCYILGGTSAVNGSVEAVIQEEIDNAKYFKPVGPKGDDKRFSSCTVSFATDAENVTTDSVAPGKEVYTVWSSNSKQDVHYKKTEKNGLKTEVVINASKVQVRSDLDDNTGEATLVVLFDGSPIDMTDQLYDNGQFSMWL